MAVKELNEIYGEVGRNLDNQMDENVLIPGETGTKTFGAFKFFSGIKKFLEGSAKKIIKGGLEVDSLTVSGSGNFEKLLIKKHEIWIGKIRTYTDRLQSNLYCYRDITLPEEYANFDVNNYTVSITLLEENEYAKVFVHKETGWFRVYVRMPALSANWFSYWFDCTVLVGGGFLTL